MIFPRCAEALLDQWLAANPEAAAYMKGMTMKPKCEWGFSAEPDYARICRELADQGATVGRVTIKGRTTETLFRDSASPIGKFISAIAVNGMPGWSRMSGDHVAALLTPKHPPVKVEGFGAPAAPATAAPTAPLTAWIQHTDFSSGIHEYILGALLDPIARDPVPTSGIAYLSADWKAYFRGGLARKEVGHFVPAPKKFGIFTGSGLQSKDYPATYASRELAETDLAKIPPAKAMALDYHVAEINPKKA